MTFSGVVSGLSYRGRGADKKEIFSHDGLQVKTWALARHLIVIFEFLVRRYSTDMFISPKHLFVVSTVEETIPPSHATLVTDCNVRYCLTMQVSICM